MKSRTILLATTLGATACTLLVDTGDLAGGPAHQTDDGGTSSGATPIGREGGATNDASGTSSGGTSGSGNPEGGAMAFCAARMPLPMFCEDFDTSAGLNLERWDSTGTDGIGTFTLDTTRFLSAPNTMVAAVPKSGNMYPPAFLRKLVGKPNILRVEADVYVEKSDNVMYGTRVLAVQLGGGATVAGGTIPSLAVFTNSELDVSEEWRDNGAQKNALHNHPQAKADGWMHVVIVTNRDARSLSVLVNGVETSDGKPLQGPITEGDSSALVGLYYPEVLNTGWSVRYDNVVIDDK